MIRVLRILSGLHTGACIKLSEGDWLLGSDPLCDILISDLAPKQGTVRIDNNNTVYFIPHNEENEQTQNIIEEEIIPEEGSVIPLYTCLTLNSIYVAIGEDIPSWPQIILPSEKNTAIENDDSIAPSASSAPAPQDALPEQNKKNDLQTSPLALTTPPAPKSKKMILRLLLVLLLLTLTVGGIWTANTPSTEEKERQDIESVIEALLVDMSPAYTYGTAPFTIKKTSDDIWHVCGAVKNVNIQEKMRLALQGLPFEVTNTIIALPDVVQSLENRIKTQGSLLQAQATQQGIRIFGYIHDEKVLDSLLAPLQEDLQCLYLQRDVVFWASLQSAVMESLTALGLQNIVQIDAGPYGLLVTYQDLSSEKKEQLKTFLQEVKDMTRGVSPFIKISSAQQQAPKEKEKEKKNTDSKNMSDFCQYISFDGKGAQLYIVYRKEKFSRGALLPNGLHVQEITEKYATFTLDERLLYCPR